jgi:hypothetical protein
MSDEHTIRDGWVYNGRITVLLEGSLKMLATVSRKKPGANRRTFNISDALYLKLQKVAYRERLNATQQLERSLDAFFADYERIHKLKIDEIEVPED